MEERLYWLLNSKGITYITISHRPVLETFHRKILCINGDKDKVRSQAIKKIYDRTFFSEIDCGVIPDLPIRGAAE